MKFRQYLRIAIALAKDHPESLDMDVVCSKDDEGNEFKKCEYPPSVGNLADIGFTAKERMSPSCTDELNAVCIN